MRPRQLLFTLVAILAPAVPASAQAVLARVVGGETSTPVFGALAYLLDGEGVMVRNSLTDELGRALFFGIPVGSYTIRVEMIGMATAETAVFQIPEGQTIPVEIRMASSAILLEGIEVEAEGGRCEVRPQEGMAVARVWEEARKALTAAAFTDQEDLYRFRTVTYERRLDRDTKAVLSEEESRRDAMMKVPFQSRPAEDLMENGFVQTNEEGQFYYAPDANVLLSDAFLDNHCFGLSLGSRESEGLIGLSFEPASGQSRRIINIAGTLWLDPTTSELRWLEFRYQNLDPDLTTRDVGGRVEFQRMPRGTWIVPNWWIRMPVASRQVNVTGAPILRLTGYKQSGGRVVSVQDSGGASLVEAETATVEGFVQDSLGMLPLRGIRVGVVGSNQEVFTNAEGRFRISGLSEGVYQIRFVDPELEEFGFVPEPVTRETYRGEVTSVIFRMPAVSDFLFEACRGEPQPEGTSVLSGTVRYARTGRSLAGATVRVEWEEIRMVGAGTANPEITGSAARGFETSANAQGFYRICGVPQNQRLTVTTLFEGQESRPDTLRIPEFSRGALYPIRWRR